MAGEPRSIKQLRSGDLLVEYTNKKQIENLLRLKSFHSLKVQVSLHASLNTWGWLGGAMVLGKLPVLGRPSNLVDSRARAYCACSGCGWGLFGHFYSHLSFLSSYSLSLGDGPI